MKQKKEARELPNNTGKGINSGKGIKRKRTRPYELTYKWKYPVQATYPGRRFK